MTWHLYLIECMDGSLYTGITNDIARRYREHLEGKGARYTQSHKPLRLVASCPVGSRSEALRAEWALKRLPKTEKITAIHSFAQTTPIMRIPVDLPHAYRLLNHGPVTLVTSAHEARQNVMAAAWAMPLDFDPPKVAVVIDANTYTRQLIEASGEFALNIPCKAIATQVLKAGSASGKEIDKFAHSGLGSFPAQVIGAPLVEGCVAWLECRILPRPDIQQRHDLFLAEVVAAQADERVFKEGRWSFSDDDLRTLHYYGGGSFALTGETIEVSEDTP
jgi:flavin reductase (DIM6/NTAB) family NADH-FMN oxidoreductase RutF/predicted GIY-YIG superfamily endonuclease